MAFKNWKYTTPNINIVYRTDDSVPITESVSTDSADFQAWIAAGNTPDPADPPPDMTPVVPSTTAKFQKVITKVNASALPAGTKTALLDILSTLVDNS